MKSCPQVKMDPVIFLELSPSLPPHSKLLPSHLLGNSSAGIPSLSPKPAQPSPLTEELVLISNSNRKVLEIKTASLGSSCCSFPECSVVVPVAVVVAAAKSGEDSPLQAPVTQCFLFARKVGSHLANRALCPVAP